MRRASDMYKKFDDIFAGHKRLAIVYEDMLENQRLRPSEARRICEFLEVQDHPMYSSFIKLNPESLEAIVLNYGELAAAVSQTEFADLVD